MPEIPEPFRAEALELLREYTGNSEAVFHSDQLETIFSLVEERKRIFLVQRTGWGKSAVYFIATKLLRRRGFGPTLLVSPLLALMRDQIKGANSILTAQAYNSSNSDDWLQIEMAVYNDEVDILLISPERLANEEFQNDVLLPLTERVGLLVIDEAHCISTWGHDFRPDYKRLKDIAARIPRGVPLLTCTATANRDVVEDVRELINIDTVIQGSLRREGLKLSAARLGTHAERLSWLASNIPTFEGSGIIYVLTIRDSERVASWLQTQGIMARAYSGRMDNESRVEIENMLLEEELKVVVATQALGMGFDHPRLKFVIHYQSPQSVIHYYQQVGRAGRQLKDSFGILFKGSEDDEINEYFINGAFPDEEITRELVRLLEDDGGWMNLSDLLSLLNCQEKSIRQILKHLLIEGAVEKDKNRFRRTLNPWDFTVEVVEKITSRSYEELSRMQRYVRESGCLNLFLLEALDDPYAEECGICQNCLGEPLGESLRLDETLVDQAENFLLDDFGVIVPRKQDSQRRPIPPQQRIRDGRYLSNWGAGYGLRVKEGRTAGEYDEELLESTCRLIEEWGPKPFPTWIAVIPSTSFSGVLENFASRLAEKLDIDCNIDAIGQNSGSYSSQKEMENSSHQAQNVRGRFRISADIPTGPVLLIDDVVDSRWTMTEIGRQLCEYGVEAVFAFALANTAPGGG